MKPKVVVLTGAGISAESGIATFRDSNGLWEEHKIEDVATEAGFWKNPELVNQFYNLRRQQLKTVEPNYAHTQLAKWEEIFDVQIITQNVDDLHERGGSENVMHLHGELLRIKSSGDPSYSIEWDEDIQPLQQCPKGHLMRPDIVWFGEDVPKIYDAVQCVNFTQALVIIGTSLAVYPANTLCEYLNDGLPLIYIDPNAESNSGLEKRHDPIYIKDTAVNGIDVAYNALKKHFNIE